MSIVLLGNGNLVELDNPKFDEVELAPGAIAPQLHRIPRFNGHLCFSYSVLQHSLWCALAWLEDNSITVHSRSIFVDPGDNRSTNFVFFLREKVGEAVQDLVQRDIGDDADDKLHELFTLATILYHDVTEVVIGDVAAPMKAQLPKLREWEDKLKHEIRKQWIKEASLTGRLPTSKLSRSSARAVTSNYDRRALDTERYAGMPEHPGWITNKPTARDIRLLLWLTQRSEFELIELFNTIYYASVIEARGIVRDHYQKPDGGNDHG